MPLGRRGNGQRAQAIDDWKSGLDGGLGRRQAQNNDASFVELAVIRNRKNASGACLAPGDCLGQASGLPYLFLRDLAPSLPFYFLRSI